jgi:hypothetical protein
MQLLPQSREALDEFVTLSVDDVESLLRVIEGWAVRAVPECVALSVTLLEEDLTFTLVDEAAGVDRPTDGGGADDPGAADGEVALDEREWAEMARERAFGGIASTVSLPVVQDGRAVLTIDLYASTAHAFHGRIEGLTAALGAWQSGAVTNADLGFDTLRRAEAAPEELRRRRQVDVAVGLVAARLGITTPDAHALLRRAAESAGITEVQAARVVLSILA